MRSWRFRFSSIRFLLMWFSFLGAFYIGNHRLSFGFIQLWVVGILRKWIGKLHSCVKSGSSGLSPCDSQPQNFRGLPFHRLLWGQRVVRRFWFFFCFLSFFWTTCNPSFGQSLSLYLCVKILCVDIVKWRWDHLFRISILVYLTNVFYRFGPRMLYGCAFILKCKWPGFNLESLSWHALHGLISSKC